MTRLCSRTRADKIQMAVREVYAERKSWRGACFEVAAVLTSRLFEAGVTSGVRLVHANPVGRGKANAGERYGHGWVEIGDQVYDLTVTDRAIHRYMFYLIGQIDGGADAIYYTAKRANTLMVRHGHYGPWPTASKKKEAVHD